MTTTKRTLADLGITRETLDTTPGRAMDLLVGIATRPTVLAILRTKGYTDAEHARGWQLLEGAAGRLRPTRASSDEVAHAIANLDNNDEELLELIDLALIRFPKLRVSVLHGIQPQEGSGVVLTMNTLFGRLRELKNTSDGQSALAVLGARGLNETEIAKYEGWVKTAMSVQAGEAGDPDDAIEAALVELRDWYDEWAGICRLYIKRRDYLIKLGLAERRQSKPDIRNKGTGDTGGTGDDTGGTGETDGVVGGGTAGGLGTPFVVTPDK